MQDSLDRSMFLLREGEHRSSVDSDVESLLKTAVAITPVGVAHRLTTDFQDRFFILTRGNSFRMN